MSEDQSPADGDRIACDFCALSLEQVGAILRGQGGKRICDRCIGEVRGFFTKPRLPLI